MSATRAIQQHLLAGLTAFALALAALPAAAATYSIDPVHTSAVFRVRHVGVANFYGMFDGVTGTVEYDPTKPEASSISVSIPADRVISRNERRDGHLMSPDFLNAKQFPTITFESTGVSVVSEEELQVAGKLTLLGVTREVTVTATKTGQGMNPISNKEVVGFETRFTIDRTDFGMNFMADGPVSPEVRFILALEAARE